MVKIQTTSQFEVLFDPSHPEYNKRYLTFYGGRGGRKSWEVARALLLRGMREKKLVLCTREHQNSINDSVKSLLENQARILGVESFYTFQDKRIIGKNGTEFIFKGIKHNIGSVKSFEGVDIVWNEEAEGTSQRSIDVLYPTIRKAGSQIITTFNPRSALDPIYLETIVNHDPVDSYLQYVSYLDNPWIDQAFVDRANKLKNSDIEAYNHIYLGHVDTRHTGSVYAKWIALAEQDGRVCNVPYDPSCEVFTAWDLGWGDSTAIWFLQFVGRELRWIDYYENNNQDLKHYVDIIKSKSYNYASRGHYLPHDGKHGNIRGASVEIQLKTMGLSNTV
ncbi:MAG: PBSX family phage terminase large subunit, partial [Culicoidibacterales bacterium]